MKIEASWALGFKVFTILYGVGLIGALLLPSREPADESARDQRPPVQKPGPAPTNSPATKMVTASSEPLTRAVLEGIYFDVIRATGQGEQLQVELRAYNTGSDRNIVSGRAKGILRPGLFAAVFDNEGRRWSADQIRIGNIASTPGFLPQIRLISGVPATIVLTFGRMPTIAGVLEAHTISRLELPVVLGGDELDSAAAQEQPTVLVFRQIPVVSH